MPKNLKDKIREADFSIFNSKLSYNLGQEILTVKNDLKTLIFSNVSKYEYAEILKARFS